jgi:4-azaleucine resistance transporter AzlC
MPTALPHYAFARGAIAVIPLSLACAPWGLLAGSMAIDAQFTPVQAQGLSAIVFAGAAQLVAIGMVKSGASLISIVLTTLLLTSQHLLYGMHMRPTLSALNTRWRMSLGFLLTDEFFALVSQYDRQTFNRWYALGVGLTFYIAWNLFTLAGIVLGKSIPGLDQLGLEFSIAATFIALITPVVRDVPTVVCVAVSLLCSVWLSFLHWESAVVVSGVLGMSAVSKPLPVYRAAPTGAAEPWGAGISRLCGTGNAHGDLRADHFPGRSPTPQPQPRQPLLAGWHQRGGVDVLDAQRVAHRVVEHGGVLSAALVVLKSGRKKARGRAGIKGDF